MECQLKDSTVYYESLGEGRPIIMIHGWSLNHRQMMDDMEPLFEHRAGWQRIYLDLPGHGRTPGKAWMTNQDRMLDVVVEFIDRVIPGQRFVVAGASLGAYLARGVVHHRPALIDGVFLAIPVIVAEDAKRTVPPHVTLVEDPSLTSSLAPDIADFVRSFVVVQSRKVIEALTTVTSEVDGTGDPAFQAVIRETPANYAFSFDVDALAEPCMAPALIIAGRQDSMVGYRDAWAILENYPRASFVVLDRSGHFLGVEQEGLFRALASEWLDRVEEYARVTK